MHFSESRADTVPIAWNPNAEADLAGYNIYIGEQPRSYTDLADVGNSTRFEWQNLEPNRTYYFAVTAYDLAGNESSFSDELRVSTGENGRQASLVDLRVRGTTQIDVVFSDPLQPRSAEEITNYRISQNIEVFGAVLASRGNKVHLVTSAHLPDGAYTLTLQNLESASGSVIPVGAAQSYRVPATDRDRIAPVITSVSSPQQDVLRLVFSEDLDESSARRTSAYSIDHGVTVLDARVTADPAVVELSTSPHQSNLRYEVSVTGVTDRAGNIIGEQNSISYVIDPGAAENMPPELVSVSVNGATQIDVNFNERLQRASVEEVGNYEIAPPVSILGAFISRDGSAVHLVTEPHAEGIEYRLTVNGVRDRGQTQIEQDSAVNYYFESAGAFDDADGAELRPHTFALFPNYPNPFNPETEIRFLLDFKTRVELQIFNPLGQLVRKLVSQELDSGFHSVLWNGKNDDAIIVPSGVYIYSLRVESRLQEEDVSAGALYERRARMMTLVR